MKRKILILEWMLIFILMTLIACGQPQEASQTEGEAEVEVTGIETEVELEGTEIETEVVVEETEIETDVETRETEVELESTEDLTSVEEEITEIAEASQEEALQDYFIWYDGDKKLTEFLWKWESESEWKVGWNKEPIEAGSGFGFKGIYKEEALVVKMSFDDGEVGEATLPAESVKASKDDAVNMGGYCMFYVYPVGISW